MVKQRFFIVLAGLLMSLSTSAQDAWSLRKCIDYAINNNLDIQAGELQNELNTLNLQQAKYNALPNLNASANHGYNWGQRIDPFTNQFASDRVRSNNFNLNSNVVLFGGFSVKNQKEQAALAVEAGEYDINQTANNVALNTAQLFLTNLLAKEQLQVLKSQRDITASQIERMEKLVAGGQEPKASLYELQAQLATDNFNIVSAENDILQSRLNLINQLQLKSEESANFDIVAPANLDLEVKMPGVNASSLYSEAISNLPDVKAAEARESQNALDVDIAKSGTLPNLTLFGSIGSGYSGANQVGVGQTTETFVPIGQVGLGGETVYTLAPQTSYEGFEARSFGDQLDQNFNQSLGLSLSIPIFNNFTNKTAVQRAKVNMELARVNTERVKNRLSQETLQAYTNAVAAMNQYMAAQSNLDALQINFDNAKVRFEQGLMNATEFNQARLQLQNQQIQLLRAKYDYIFRTKIIDLYLGQPINLD